MTEVKRVATLGESSRLREQICERLRDRIIAGELQPGHRLVERDLAEEFGVSRVPVGEAIRILISEGFLEVLSPRRIVVRQLSRRDVVQLFDVREALEVLATRLATERASAAGLARLDALVEKARQATLSERPDRISRANADFHHHIVALAENDLLASMLEPLEGRLRWLFQQVDDPGRLWQEHHDLYAAIASGDAEAAAALSLTHVRQYRAIALELLFGEAAEGGREAESAGGGR